MVSWRLACCWARPARGFSCWGPFSFLAAGALCYLLLSALFRLEAFREVVAIVRRQLKKKDRPV